MNDTISRQAAIDVLDVLCQEHRYKIPGKAETYSQYNEAWQDALDRAENAIGNLPSAQPEPQWIPVKKGYPTESGYYNVTIMGYLDDRLEPAVEYYSPNTARDKKRWKAINVIAWRPADVYRE